jgi:hypothetical protein
VRSSTHGRTARADHEHQRDEPTELRDRDERGHERAAGGFARRAAERLGDHRQQDERDDGEHVLDDEPPDGDATVLRRHGVSLRERAQ